MTEMKLAIVVAFVLATLSGARASEEEIHHWRSATLTGDTSLFGAVEVRAAADSSGNVQTLEVTAKGVTVVIPPKWLNTLPSLPLASIQLRTERGYDPQPWLYVYFRTTSQPQVAVHIAIQDGKLRHASITTVDANGNRKDEQRKAP
jgi:hypothetical protein